MITGAIFDMDGVLLDSMPVWENVGALYLKERGKKPEAGLRDILFTKSLPEAAEFMRESYHLSESPEEIVGGIIAVVRSHYETKIPMKAGVLSFLKKLREAGVRMAVATASDRYLAEVALRRHGILEYVEELFTCSDVGAGKGASPAVYLIARERLGTDIGQTWVFEDAVHAVRTAGGAGFPTVGVYDASSEDSQGMLREEATVYLKDLTDFEQFYRMAAQYHRDHSSFL